MSLDKLDENIPFLKGKELVDVTQEQIESLVDRKGLRIEKLTTTYPAQGLHHATQYWILGYVDPKSGKYIDDKSIQSGGMANGMVERHVELVVSPDTGLVYIVRTSSSTGDPIDYKDSLAAARLLEEFSKD